MACFAQRHVVPAVAASGAAALDRDDLCRAVVEIDAVLQTLHLRIAGLAEQPDCVFALDYGARLHELRGQVAVGGEHDEPRRVEIHGAYVDPSPLAWPRQVASWTTLGRAARRAGFVVREEVVLRPGVRGGGEAHRFAVETYALAPL